MNPTPTQNLTGGLPCLLLGLNAYITDVSLPHERTMRLAFVELMFIAGLAVSGWASGPIFNAYGYDAIYSSGLVLFTLALLYAAIFVKETKKPGNIKVLFLIRIDACVCGNNIISPEQRRTRRRSPWPRSST